MECVRELVVTQNLSIAAGAYELAGYAHIEFEFSLVTYLNALKAACLRLRNIKAHLQKAGMTELVAATGMWKYRCDNLKRDVMEQVKGMRGQYGLGHVLSGRDVTIG